jgi:O-antigen ligase
MSARVESLGRKSASDKLILSTRVPLATIADWLVIGLAASLPWSTSATGILAALWVLALLPTLDLAALRRELRTLAGALPVVLWLLAAAGMVWADVAWSERIAGLAGFLKLLAIPLLLAHFRRSDKAAWVLAAFLLACALLLATSYFVALWPGLTWRGVRGGLGVPVKDYIAQSGEFAICVFALLAIAMSTLRARPWIALGLFVLIALFLVDVLYFATARTALVVLIVLLLVFSFRQFGWRKGALAVVAATLVASAIWQSSAFLRTRVGMVPAEVERYWNENTRTPSGERLEYWRKSVAFIADAPVLGQGTGSIEELFRRSAVGDEGASAVVSGNPHNQTLAVGVQLGVLGAIVLWAMWISHLMLFRGPGLPAWIGLLMVLQNMVSSLFNSHLFDFTQGWIYVVGVGVAGGAVLQSRERRSG